MSHERAGDTVPAVSTADAPQLDPRRWKALALLGAAFFMVILDGTIVLTAVPSMSRDLGFSGNDVQWVITAYALTFGGLMIFFGRVADLLGRRRVFLAGIGLFVLSSLLCGLAWTGGVLIAARTVQGLSAAAMAPAALSIVMTTFPEGVERNKALGIWGGLGGIGATAGLLIGGTVTSLISWEWIFLLNVPVGVGVLALGPVLLRESHAPGRSRALDPGGAVAVTASLVLLVYAIFRAPEVGWARLQTIGLLASSAALMALFVVIEARSAAPLMPLRIFRLRTLVGGNIVIFTAGMAVDGMLFMLTLYAQQVRGYSAAQFGLMATAMTVAAIAGALAGQHIVTRTGARPVAGAGTLLIAVGCALLAWTSTGEGDLVMTIVALLIFGVGMGAAFVTAQITALTAVAERDSGLASGLVETSFNIGAGLGIAIASTVAISRTKAVLAGGAQGQHLPALAEGLRWGFAVAVVFALAGLVAAAVLLRGVRPGGPAGSHRAASAKTGSDRMASMKT